MSILRVSNLCKEYPKFTLSGVSFCLEKGTITGLIGRNGAGKSTTLKGLLGLIPTEGEIEYFGLPFAGNEKEIKRKTGYVAGGFDFYKMKTLQVIKKVYSLFYPTWDNGTYDELCREFSLDEKKKVSELSQGMKVKFSLALALSHGAELLILDEPTSGLDPLSREEICDILLALVSERNVTVLFSTHVTSDLTRIADNVVFLSDGKVLLDEPLDVLLDKYVVVTASTKEELASIVPFPIGIKKVKSGFECLAKTNSLHSPIGEKADLDRIMIHLESDKGGIL